MRKKRQSHAPIQAFADMDCEFIEVLDEKSHPLMIMPRDAALSQHLPYQAVLVVVRNREKRVYIHCRADSKKVYGGLWNVSASGVVKAGEAIEDAAVRELSEELGITGVPISLVATVAPSPDTDWGRISLFVSSPSNAIVNPAPEEISSGMFVDEDELAAFLRDMPEMIAPGLKWAARIADLFKL